ncbi:GNAT family N-acetyltransferase [Apilactobacillus xinyiensis]|uniref:GNAT family N-acetyltransferase n=1 Tax=Apilactobacillus xinyiensis TaxID=2841032 RepID=UPI001C7CAED1|nr:GNAT family N-acetyltransferase [Apilactobacillus xinyiensis]
MSTYLKNYDAYSLKINNQDIGIIVVMKTNPLTMEIMNLSIDEHFRNKHYGTKLLKFVIDEFQNKCKFLEICTGSTSFEQLYLYQKMGFRCTTVERDFFNKKCLYPNEILENGLILKDKIRLQIINY